MQTGQVVLYRSAAGGVERVDVVSVSGEVPGPRVLDLRAGNRNYTAVPHVSVAAAGAACWSLTGTGFPDAPKAVLKDE